MLMLEGTWGSGNLKSQRKDIAMKLRWFIKYNENGLDSKKELQYWDDESKEWKNVNTVRCSFKLERIYLSDPDQY